MFDLKIMIYVAFITMTATLLHATEEQPSKLGQSKQDDEHIASCKRQRPPNLYDKNRRMIMMRRYQPYRCAYYRFQKKCYEKSCRQMQRRTKQQ